MLPSTFPLSIVAQIIDILANQKRWRDVKKFSALSSFCHQHCRKCLFANIKVGEDEEGLDDDEDAPPMSPIERFITLINEHPETAPHVHHLCLVDPQEDDQIELLRVLTKLVNLSSLEVYMIRGTIVAESGNDDSFSHMLQAVSTIPSLKSLILRGVEEFPLKALAPLIHLQHLELDHVELVQHRSFKVSSSPPRLQSLTILDYDDFGSDGKLSCLKMKRKDGKFLLDLSGLKKVQFGPFSGTSLKAASDIFRSHHINGLEELSIGISSNMKKNSAKGLEDLVIPQKQTLKTLDFFSTHRPGAPDPYSKLCEILNRLESSNVLTYLRITVDVESGFEMVVGDEWRALCNTLTRPGWKHLELVALRIPTFPDDTRSLGELGKLHQYLEPLFSQSFKFDLDFSLYEQCNAL